MPFARLRRCLPAVAAALLLAACGSSAGGSPAASPVGSASVVRDPLLELADTTSPQYTDDSSRPVLHASGRGPAHFTIPRPEEASAIRFYVSCSPDSRFRVSIGTWFSGGCSTSFQNSGQLPLGPVGQPVTVHLDLPAGVDYWIVGLAVG